MYRIAYPQDENTVVYFDKYGNKHIRKGGNLSWRINNPGLIKSHSHFAKRNGSIGSCHGFAIFSHAEQGHKALSAWLHSKKHFNATVQALAEHYHSKNADAFAAKLSNCIPTMKEGLNQEALVQRWALDDALLYLDSVDAFVFESFMKQRISHYENLMKKISNITILDPDPSCYVEHQFCIECYQKEVKRLVEKYKGPSFAAKIQEKEEELLYV